MTARALGIAAVVLASALALTGCGAPSAPAPANTGDNGAATSGPADPGTGTDGGAGEGTALPDTYPTDEVPLIEGDVAYSQDLGTGWVVYIARDDFLGGYEEAKGLLLGAGFTGDTVGSDETGAFGQFKNDKYTVNLQGANADNTGFGNAVGYTVVKNG